MRPISLFHRSVLRGQCSLSSAGKGRGNERKVVQLVSGMRAEGLHALLVPTSDSHLGEYIAPRYERRRYISEFTGSAGTAVVLHTGETYLWTDGRWYFNQAEMELPERWNLMKSGEEGVPSLSEFLSKLPTESVVGIDPALHSAHEFLQLQTQLGKENITLHPVDRNLVDTVWDSCDSESRPAPPSSLVRIHPLQYAGMTTGDKAILIRQNLLLFACCNKEYGVILSELDEIAWTFNIRGDDIPFNPLSYSFALITRDDLRLYIDLDKLSPYVSQQLTSFGVTLHPYESFRSDVVAFAGRQGDGATIFVDEKTVNYSIYSAIPPHSRRTVSSPVAMLKSCKNDAEATGMRQCHRRDGAAVVHFLSWLRDHVLFAPTNTISEVEVDEKITHFRQVYSPDHFLGRSFDTIAGVNGNGAIVHYRAEKETCEIYSRDDLLLLDSGGQYVDGTTDITRSIHLGQPSVFQKEVYTRVLMGHIDLASTVFPCNTSGLALDAIARRRLWEVGLDYQHGTGHGVGAALCVHEGPQRIANKSTPSSTTTASHSLSEGMIVSIEPGYYEAEQFGIRLENLYIVSPMDGDKDSKYLQFNPLTFVPFDRNLLITSMLSEKQLVWLNEYHALVEEEVKPLVDGTHAEWLEDACRPMTR